jgi:hypothetical protein
VTWPNTYKWYKIDHKFSDSTDYSKDLHSYLKYCKDVVFPGIACSVDEEHLIGIFQDMYKGRTVMHWTWSCCQLLFFFASSDKIVVWLSNIVSIISYCLSYLISKFSLLSYFVFCAILIFSLSWAGSVCFQVIHCIGINSIYSLNKV